MANRQWVDGIEFGGDRLCSWSGNQRTCGELLLIIMHAYLFVTSCWLYLSDGKHDSFGQGGHEKVKSKAFRALLCQNSSCNPRVLPLIYIWKSCSLQTFDSKSSKFRSRRASPDGCASFRISCQVFDFFTGNDSVYLHTKQSVPFMISNRIKIILCLTVALSWRFTI